MEGGGVTSSTHTHTHTQHKLRPWYHFNQQFHMRICNWTCESTISYVNKFQTCKMKNFICEINFHMWIFNFISETTPRVHLFVYYSQIFGARLINTFGRAENVKADVSVGTNTKSCYHLGFTKPLNRSLYKK